MKSFFIVFLYFALFSSIFMGIYLTILGKINVFIVNTFSGLSYVNANDTLLQLN